MCGEYLVQNVVYFSNHTQVCNDAPAYRDGPNVYSTCGRACASLLRSAYDLPNTNNPPISESFPPNSALAPRNNADIARSDSRPYQMGLCDVSTPIYDSERHCLLQARYVMSALDIKVKAKYTLLVDSAVLLNCKPLKCVM